MWNVLSFKLAKAGKGRACPPVIYITFNFIITLLTLSNCKNTAHFIHTGVKESATVCMYTLCFVFSPCTGRHCQYF